MFTTWYSKKGKFPSVKSEKAHYTKISPHKIKMISYAGKKGLPKEGKIENDMTELQMPEMRKKFE